MARGCCRRAPQPPWELSHSQRWAPHRWSCLGGCCRWTCKSLPGAAASIAWGRASGDEIKSGELPPPRVQLHPRGARGAPAAAACGQGCSGLRGCGPELFLGFAAQILPPSPFTASSMPMRRAPQRHERTTPACAGRPSGRARVRRQRAPRFAVLPPSGRVSAQPRRSSPARCPARLRPQRRA